MAAERHDAPHVGVLAGRGDREVGQFAFALAFRQRALVQIGLARFGGRAGRELAFVEEEDLLAIRARGLEKAAAARPGPL